MFLSRKKAGLLYTMEINVICDHENFIAVEKPQGTPVQPDKTGDADLKTIVQNFCGSECFVINRLDRPVGGIVLMAKEPAAAAEFTKIMTNGGIDKYYKCIINGFMESKNGVLNDFMWKNSRTNMSEICGPEKRGSKKASLEYEVEEEFESLEYGKLSLVKIKLITGRHHQIRLQFSSRGHAVLGDRKYGGRAFNFENMPISLWSWKVKFTYKRNVYNLECRPHGGVFDKIFIKN